jgi:hypothetical protein
VSALAKQKFFLAELGFGACRDLTLHPLPLLSSCRGEQISQMTDINKLKRLEAYMM